MRIKLSEHFTYKKILRLVLPSSAMMVFISIYGMVDGFFVSNFVGETSFAAVNLTWPAIMIFGGVGFMFGTGGNAIISRALGEDKKDDANEYFSLVIYATILVGLLLSAIALLLREPICKWLGAEGELLKNCMLYCSVIFPCIPFFMLQNVFQALCATAEKPRLSLYATIAAGLSNVALDAFFILGLKLGLLGAALGTASTQVLGGLIPLIYFCRKNNSLLRLGKTKFYGKVLLKTCTNGASELVANITLSLVSILYNLEMIKIAGELGVNAYGIVMYVAFVIISIYLGYTVGIAPVIGYNYGAKNIDELQNVFKKSLVLTAFGGAIGTLISEVLARPFTLIFANGNPELTDMTVHGFRIFALAFLFGGFSMFASAFFTALGNGAVSATIAFLRTFVFQILPLYILPRFFGIDGVWMAMLAAEVLGLIISIIFFVAKRKRYNYY